MISKPDLKQYLSSFQYLQDIYNYRKSRDPQFSYRTWSMEMNINNRSYLRMIVSGKRSITDDIFVQLVKNIPLSPEESDHFRLLVDYSQAKSKKQRELVGPQLMSLMKAEKREVISRTQHFLSSLILPRIRVLLGFEDLAKNPRVIREILEIDESTFNEALHQLTEEGHVEKRGEKFSLKNNSFVVPDKHHDEKIRRFHDMSLQEAMAAQDLPAQIRRYKSILIPLGEREFVDFIEELQSFVDRTLMKYNSASLQNRRLYQINFNSIPVSKPLKDKAAEQNF